MARIDRLLQLAAHLESGQLAHGKFQFDTFSNGPFDTRHCGTAGCALGELPAAFPDVFQWAPPDYERDVIIAGGDLFKTAVLMDGNETFFDRAAQIFFDINQGEYFTLFTPSGSGLGIHATAAQVAAGIRAFCDRQN